MTNPIEQEFYRAFDIEPKYYCSYHDCNCPIEDVGKFNKKCPKQAVTKECDARSNNPKYPPITDRILLELICAWNKKVGSQISLCTMLTSQSMEKLKEEIIEQCIEFKQEIYNAVRKIMGVENE